MFIPTDTAIERVMQETGMGKMQAVNHLRGRAILQERAARGERRTGGRSFR